MVNKLTNTVKPLDEVDKINEIIDALDDKQDTLVSGTNIKTINNNSILGSGNLTLDGLPSQTGNANKFLTTDGTDASWAAVPTRNIGEIVASTIPLTDAGVHLLDGALIQGDGMYSAFVTDMAAISETNPELFCTEQEWQQSVTDYGVCGKFVYDSVNNTLRLQKFYSAERYLIASHSSGTEWYRVYSDGWCEQGGRISVSSNTGVTVTLLMEFANANYYANWISCTSVGQGGEGSRSASSLTTTTFYVYNGQDYSMTANWRACGYTDISSYKNQTQYQYIVIATSTKTDIQVDIDEVVTDLNSKADVDLTNVPASKAILQESYVNGTSWYRVYSDGWCEQGGILYSGEDVDLTVTFLKPYKNTNYIVDAQTENTAKNQYNNGINVGSKTSQGFVMYIYTGGGNRAWQASGYIN